MLASLRKILQPVSRVPNLAIPVQRICELVVALLSCTKLTKVGHQHARKILNDISEKDSIALVGSYLEERLEKALGAMITILTKRSLDVSQEGLDLLQNEKFNQLLDETKELLKLSSGVQRFKHTNICRQETLA